MAARLFVFSERMTRLFNLLWIQRQASRYWEITVMSMWPNGWETIIFLIISDILILISNCMTKYNRQTFMTFDSLDKRRNRTYNFLMWYILYSKTLNCQNTNYDLFVITGGTAPFVLVLDSESNDGKQNKCHRISLLYWYLFTKGFPDRKQCFVYDVELWSIPTWFHLLSILTGFLCFICTDILS